MSGKLTATFDGATIDEIDGIETVNHHQLFVISRWLERNGPDGADDIGGSLTIIVEMDGLCPAVSVTRDINHEHCLALAGELLFGAQLRFNSGQAQAAQRMMHERQEMINLQQMLKGKTILPQ